MNGPAQSLLSTAFFQRLSGVNKGEAMNSALAGYWSLRVIVILLIVWVLIRLFRPGPDIKSHIPHPGAELKENF
jgi:hypothetical protein